MKRISQITDAKQLRLFHITSIVVLVLAAYGNIFNHGFVWDDFVVIVDNPMLESIKNIPLFFISEDKIDLATGYYRPITYVSFLLDRTLWGLNPLGFNITNLMLHIAAAVAFYLVVAELFKKEWYAFTASLLFSLHPIVNETVNFHAGGRNTLLCALFALLSFFFHMKRRHAAALACFILAIFSKEFALLMPLFFLYYDRFISDEKVPWKYYFSYIVSAIAYLVIRSYVVATPDFSSQLKIGNILLLTPKLVVGYLANMLLPFRLQTMYEFSAADRIGQMVPYLLALFAMAAAVIHFRKNREILLSASWFIIFLLPVSGVFFLGSAFMADRYAYFSSMGFAMALASVIGRAPGKAVIAVMLLLCGWYAVTDFQRNSYWKDEFTLYSQMIKDAPQMSIGHQNLSTAYLNKGDFDNAERHLLDACFIATDNKVVFTRLTETFWEMKKYNRVMAVLQMKIDQEPNNPHPYMQMSRIYGELGDKANEKSFHDKAIQLFPRTEEVMNEQATKAFREGEKLLAERRTLIAKSRFQDALNIDLNFVPALVGMGILGKEKRDYEGAIRFLSRAIAIDPSNASAHYHLSMVYQMQGRSVEAGNEMKKFREVEAVSKQKEKVSGR